MMKSRINRRHFLQKAAGAGVATSCMVGTLASLAATKVLAADDDDYRALVCVFLYGGNDSYNMLVPRSIAAYDEYAQARQNLALERSSLLPINPITSDGNDYGLHASMPGLQGMFESERVAFAANLGALVAPTSKSEFQNNSVPQAPNLFSHNSQQDYWQSVEAFGVQNLGWAGKIADILSSTTNTGSSLPMNISLDGNNLLQVGQLYQAYNADTGGVPYWNALDGNQQRQQVLDDMYAASRGGLFEQSFTNIMSRSLMLSENLRLAFSNVPEPTTTFADNHFSSQLRAISHLVAARNELGMRRQIFFVGFGGFDTHDGQLYNHERLLTTLDSGLTSFQQEMEAIGCENSVTTFTASDFGRTLTSNGDGSDHGWGSHQLVMGGAVAGKNIIGEMPALVVEGTEDVGQGRIIPTTSVDQYGATLAKWFGVADSDLNEIFPNLPNFNQRDLGLFKPVDEATT